MKIHKEGYKILIAVFLFLLFTNTSIILLFEFELVPVIILIISISFLLFISLFFRYNIIEVKKYDKFILAPADGKIVAIEKTLEQEYFKDERIQVSIFMSSSNMHVNWYPIDGIIKYKKYHKGKYLAAWNPKSSVNNERASIVIQNKKTIILLKQIAGVIARRIISYGNFNEKVTQGQELGFIKFGSRVDIFLPADIKLDISLNQKVKGRKTILAHFE